MRYRMMALVLGMVLAGLAWAEVPAVEAWQPADSDAKRVLLKTPLFDAEGEKITGQYWVFSSDAHGGAKAFQSVQTRDATPRFKHGVIDLTNYTELWLWMRSDVAATVGIKGRSYLSSRVDTDECTVTIGPEWGLVRIELEKIDKEKAALRGITEWIVNAREQNGVYPTVFIDDVWAVKLQAIDPEPVVEPTPDPVIEPTPDPEPDPVPEPPTYGQPIPVSFTGGTLLWESAGSDGSVLVQEYAVDLRITVSGPVVSVTPPPG